MSRVVCSLFGLCLDALESLDLTMDENKENQTPEGVQGELDWVQQYSLDQEREEQELQQALAQSLQEQVRSLAVNSMFYEFNKIVLWTLIFTLLNFVSFYLMLCLICLNCPPNCICLFADKRKHRQT